MHPYKKEGVTGHNEKLRRMTRDYGMADPKMYQTAPVNRLMKEGGQEAVSYGADSSTAKPRGDRKARTSVAANPLATYATGGRVAARARGGRAMKGKGTHVNVIVTPQAGNAAPMPMPAIPPTGLSGAAPMVPPMPPRPMPPMAMGMPPAPGMIPPGIMPPRKRGGRVAHPDEKQDVALIKKMLRNSHVEPGKRARGGAMNEIHMTAGSESGPGRLEKAAARRRNARHEKPQAVTG